MDNSCFTIEKSDLQNKALSDNISSEERIFEYWQDVLSSLKNEDNLKSLYISLKDSAALYFNRFEK